MIYAQFYNHSVTIPGECIEACGDRSVLILDGRCTRAWMHEVSKDECQKRGYMAWRLFQGPRFSASKPISKLMPIEVEIHDH